MKMTIFVEKEAESRSLGDVVCWNIQDSRRDKWPLLGAFNLRSKSPVPPGERLMGTGYFIRPSTSLARIWGCNCVCFGCCFVLQADKGEPAGWSGLGRGSQGAVRSGRSRSRRGKQVMKAWRFLGCQEDRTGWETSSFMMHLSLILNSNVDFALFHLLILRECSLHDDQHTDFSPWHNPFLISHSVGLFWLLSAACPAQWLPCHTPSLPL